MTSPFPGMDPYLEGSRWPDVHKSIIYVIRRELMPLITPKYIAVVEPYTVKDTNREADKGVIYPDVALVLEAGRVEEAAVAYGNKKVASPPSFKRPIFPPLNLEIPVIAIRDREHKRLVTAIEVLSPVNKRKPGFEPFLKKKEQLLESGVHFLEIDLLRRGKRTAAHEVLKNADYLVTLTHARNHEMSCWEIDLKEALPTIPVPLLQGDKDVPLDLQTAFEKTYNEAGYQFMINYKDAPPPPAFSKAKMEWMQNILEKKATE